MTALPERTVEAAARDAFWRDDVGGHIRGRWTWDAIPEEGRENYRATIREAITAAMDPALGPDRLVVAGEHEREVRADQTRRIVEWLRHNIKPAIFAAAVAEAVECKFGGGDDAKAYADDRGAALRILRTALGEVDGDSR